MKKLRLILASLFAIMMLATPLQAGAASAAEVRPCDPTLSDKGQFLGIPHWYEYLKSGKQLYVNGIADGPCTPQLIETDGGGVTLLDFWLIALAVIGILLRLTGIIALFMVIYGGFKYITSQGNPDATKGARETIINAFIGIVITIIAAASVNFGAILLQP